MRQYSYFVLFTGIGKVIKPRITCGICKQHMHTKY